MSPKSDFMRELPGSERAFARRPGLMQRLRLDPVMMFLLAVITTYGLVVLYSASGRQWENLEKQGAFFCIAYVGMLVVAQIDTRHLARLAPWAYGIGILMLVAVLLVGTGAKGAVRWLSIGGFRFQPSEFMKLAVPMTLAALLANRVLPPSFRWVLASLLVIFLPALLIAKQPDLGTALLIAASGLFVLFLSGLNWWYIGGAALAAGAATPVMWMYGMHDYQKNRVLTLLDPTRDKLGTGWNIIQSKTAIGSGGFDGKGWLQGTQSHLDFLPESHTDFIIAVLAEEFGLLGVTLLLLIYAAIILRGLQIAARARDTYGRLIAGSITLTFFVYVFVNMGMVSGILPIVGVPLPLVSQGGTALVTLLAGFGVLMNVATQQKRLLD